MERKEIAMNIIRTVAFALMGLLTFLPITAHAQSLYIDPPHQHIANRPWNGVEILTLTLSVDGGIASSVAWGTTITLADTNTLQFVQNFGGNGKPFHSTNSFFDRDLSPLYAANSGTLSLNFVNFTPGATLGHDGPVTLGQFQVRVLQEPNFRDDFPFGGRINLAGLEVPPFGSAVQDEFGNNLLDAAFGASVSSRPPSPEPSSWLVMVGGIGMCLMLRRRGCKTHDRRAR
jgi:hypothetical protein